MPFVLEVQAHTTGIGLPMIDSILDLAEEMTIHRELYWNQLMPLLYSSFTFPSSTKSEVFLSGDFQTRNWELSILHSSRLLATIRVLPDVGHQGTCPTEIAVLDFHPVSGSVVGA